MDEPDLVRRLEDRIDRGWADEPAEDEFDRLARDVFAFQFERVAPYARLCESRSVTPGSIESWREIPLVPTAAFQHAVLSAAPGPVARVFETSGTTRGRSGRHHAADLRLYRRALGPTVRRHVLPDRSRIRMAILAPRPEEAPTSSLSYMLGALAEDFGEGETPFLVTGGDLDHVALASFLASAREPVLLFGTSFAFVHALERLAPVRLPQGSRIVDTGGYKGRSRALAREEFLPEIERAFGVGERHVVSEYGMTELSSQFYDRHLALGGPGGVKSGGPWARVRIVDPVTLEERAPGEPGLVAILDLLNLWSVSSILTGDVGVQRAGGFEVLGRAAEAGSRGCSIAADEALGGR